VENSQKFGGSFWEEAGAVVNISGKQNNFAEKYEITEGGYRFRNTESNPLHRKKTGNYRSFFSGGNQGKFRE
jgi:hypothetical protein